MTDVLIQVIDDFIELVGKFNGIPPHEFSSRYMQLMTTVYLVCTGLHKSDINFKAIESHIKTKCGSLSPEQTGMLDGILLYCRRAQKNRPNVVKEKSIKPKYAQVEFDKVKKDFHKDDYFRTSDRCISCDSKYCSGKC